MVLKAGLIGLGMMGRNHARVLQSTDGMELVGVADPMGDSSGAAGSAQVVDTVAALIDLGVDVAVVACPTEDHEPTALALAEAGVHALIEKPLAVNMEQAQRIVQAFADAGLVGAVGHIERFNPAIRGLRERLRAGELGDVFQVATRRVGPFPNRIRDVGVIKDLATHDLDLTAWVGGADYQTIFAQTAHKAGRSHEDLVAATDSLANGVITNHLVNWLSPMKERLVVASGENGCFVADTLLADLTFFKNGDAPQAWEGIAAFRGVSEGDMIRYAMAKPEPLRVEIEAFRDAVNGEDADIVTMTEGLAAVAAADAALESAATGQSSTVEVSP